jgi:hypothetical protein
MAMSFGQPKANKFYYGKDGETTVNQENFWKRATKREWKIKGAKERGYAEEIDQRKIDQMQQFLHHRSRPIIAVDNVCRSQIIWLLSNPLQGGIERVIASAR